MKRGIVLVFVAVLAACGPKPEDLALARAKLAVSESMRDPAAAQFRALHARFRPAGNDRVLGKSEAGWIVCGEVNGKNLHGGYVGYRPFRFSDPSWPKVDPKPFVIIREPTEFKDPLDPEVWDAFQKVECDGADASVARKLQQKQVDAWSERNRKDYESARDELESLQSK